MIKINKLIWLFGLSIIITSCNVNNELPETEAESETITAISGSADFSNYIAIGASFTAGFTDGALFIAAQEDSFPNTLASKFALAGGGDFNQPLMEDNIGGLLYEGSQIQNSRFYFNGNIPAILPATPTTETTDKLTETYHNYGIPGAKSFHLVTNGYGSVTNVPLELSNPYYARFSSSETSNVLTDALTNPPTFFTLSEIGGNDVLGYALAGGDGVDQSPTDDNLTGNLHPSTYGSNDITNPLVFDTVLNNMVSALTENGAKGVITNIPYITSLSNFTTVPYNAIPLDTETATTLNANFADYNASLLEAQSLGYIDVEEVAKRTINFTEGNNAVTIIDENLTDLSTLDIPNYRQAIEDDLLILASSTVIGQVNTEAFATFVAQGLDQTTAGQISIEGLTFPLEDKWVLTTQEQILIETATDAYNATIDKIASSNENLVMVDLNSVLTEAATSGIQFDDYNLTTALVTGGLISLDGVHLTARGYALMANKILEAIDNEFGSNFTLATNGLAKADDFPTNYSPTLQ